MSDRQRDEPQRDGHFARLVATLGTASKAEIVIAVASAAWLLNSFAPWRTRVGASALIGWTAGRLARFSILWGLGSLVLVAARFEGAAFVRGRPAGVLYTIFGGGSLAFALATYGFVPPLMSAAVGTWAAIALSAALLAAGNAIRRREERSRAVDK